MLVVIEEAHRTDTGRQRHANEDSYYASAPVFAVADGMGGAQAGEVASRIAAGAFEKGVDSEGPAEGQLETIALDANREIHERAQRDSSRAGMGTTLTAAMVRGNEVALSHVGDSRAYVFRDGELKRLTKDHSLVEELRRQGRLTEEEAEEHPQRSIITRALGPEPEVNVDTMTVPATPGDVFLLCSDGLTTMVSDEEIRKILSEARSLRSAVNKLIDAANSGGGRDNITAVAFRLAEEGEAPDEGATLISRTAEQAGLTAERVRQAGDRLRGQGPMPLPHRRRRWLRALAIVAAVAAVIAGALLIGRSIYFLGTDEDGRVAVYRGLPYELPLGVNLYSEQESIGVQAGALSPERQDVVTEHKLRSHDDAYDILADIEANEGAVPPTPAAPAPATAKKKKQQQAGTAKQGAEQP
ncbi:MAG TPA: Stp1/IreP family PP2C-type Ser/Thr phosphatase [Solirubrobacterales bacterium]|jgi:protein phosphatase|nr:Stp1/IreP family PP2C-type Ser/Thr phosphatase [Solirubrobacterales bacterium]